MQETQELWVGFLVGNIPWRRKWQPTSVFLPGESQGRRSLVGCRLWGRSSSGKEAWRAAVHAVAVSD